jgi:TP901 family phage tail tape measure protein
MARQVETANAVVNLDGRNAENQLKDLKQRAAEVRKEMIELGKANDKAGYDRKEKELKLINQQMRQLKAETFNVAQVMKNLNGTNLNDLQRSQRAITAELSKMSRGTSEYVAKSKQLQLVQAEIRKVKNEMNGMSASQAGFFSRLTDGFNKYFGIVTTLAASLTGIVFSFKKTTDAFKEYEKSVDELSSLTGLVGDDLEWLSTQAKELSTGMLEGSIRVTASAQDIVKAFTLVGSAKPELLANKEALAEVTKQAIILSEASGMALPDAVRSLTDTMNQFNAPAEEAGLYIDALAAGSKYGAAAIPEIADAIVKFGVGAANSNISVQESVALIELLGEKGLKGSEAGTKLNGILNKMAGAKGLGKDAIESLERYGVNIDLITDKSIPFEVRLQEVSKISGDTAAMIKVFGLENKNAAEALLTSLPRYKELAEQITETGVASEQAAINTDNAASRQAQAMNKAQKSAIELGERLMPVLTFSTNFVNKLMIAFLNLMTWLEKNRTIATALGKAIAGLTAGIAAYWVATKGVTVAQKLLTMAQASARTITLAYAAAKALLTGNITRATAAIKLMNLAAKASPIGLIAAAVSAAVVAFVAFNNKAKEAAQWQKDLAQAAKDSEANLAAETGKVNSLFDALKKTNPQSKERAQLIDYLNKNYGTHLKNMQDEKAFLDQIAIAQQQVIDGIKRKIDAQLKEEQLTILMRERTKAQEEHTKAVQAYNKWSELMQKKGVGFMESSTDALQWRHRADLVLATSKEIKKLDAEIDKLAKSYGNSVLENILGSPSAEVSSVGSISEDAQKKHDEMLKALQEHKKKIVEENFKLSQEYKSLQDREIEEVKRKYQSLIDEASKYENDRTELGREWGRVKQEHERQMNEEIRRINEKFAAQMADQEYQQYLQRLEQRRKELEDEEALEKRKLELREEYGLITLEQKLAQELQELKTAYMLDAINYEEYLKLKADLEEKYRKGKKAEDQKAREEDFEDFNKFLQEQQAITQHFSNAISSIKEAEFSAIEEQEERGIISKEQAERKKKEIAKKYAVAEFLVKIASIVANTAAAVMQAWAQLGPIGAAIATPFIIATGAAQGVIAGQELAKIQGYRHGLYPVTDQNGQRYNANFGGVARTGIVDRPTVFLAGEDGSAMPEMIIDGPTFRNLQINFPEAISAIESSRVRGFADGYYPQPTREIIRESKESMYINPELKEALNQFISMAKKGIKAKLVYRDLEEMEENISVIKNDFKP